MTIMLPKIDAAFKLLFGDPRNKNILADFLKAVLPDLADEEFVELTIVDPHLKRECIGDKLEILDIKILTASGKVIDIEIQISALPEMRPRITYYLSNMITEQLGMGGDYDELKQAISIVVTDYDFIPETGRCHTVFRMLEKEEHFAFNELMEINVLNMKKLPADDTSRLGEWLRFLKAEGEEELKMVAERNPIIKEAYCRLQVMSEDDEARMVYEARLKAQRDEYSRVQGALREGREEGLKEGRNEGLKEGEAEATRNIIREMGRNGMDVKAIAVITHKSEGDINSILKGKDA
jgi:predicted transposase/invertase (TIGR01784 family)